MPAYLTTSQATGLKVVSLFPQNAIEHNLSNIHALVVLLDTETGRPAALIDGTYLTALRTGAASGVATRVLARTDARVLAIFGAGAQAPLQVAAVCAIRPIKRIWVANRTQEHAKTFAMALRNQQPQAEIQIASAPGEALAEADVVCCATSSTTPLFDDSALHPGMHINGVGSFTPHMSEVPTAMVARSRILVDQHSAAWAEAGDLIQARDAGVLDMDNVTELGEVLAGQAVGRTSAEEITFFKSVGVAVQDMAVAQLARSKAVQHNYGTVIPFK
ncbi:MAG: ornithine cyclodeaminase [Chloroflexi bacterium AL-W]|nr:ornithine cyclodeaminase [Chloroflexi bacterium AL-N1]NOK66400.1 ornithine cyclodeaminase [Chloroflexi bacterium AL-N10]NOK71788.1 ornithine cyclodeaminase [Chloroflexi bacterium AL-N5]NOK81045.1 ornithine cyclodeaminase [Chloroflexi bacterium AL-W]NOK89318.1 ornithine cyclodeaminase [Chloroflexi bacterium AL-N15]